MLSGPSESIMSWWRKLGFSDVKLKSHLRAPQQGKYCVQGDLNLKFGYNWSDRSPASYSGRVVSSWGPVDMRLGGLVAYKSRISMMVVGL